MGIGTGIINRLGFSGFQFWRLSRGLVLVRAKAFDPERSAKLQAELAEHERATCEEARAFAADYEKRYSVSLFTALNRSP